MLGWNIFPFMAAAVVLLAFAGAVVALVRRERSGVAMLLMAGAIAIMLTFIAMLWLTLQRARHACGTPSSCLLRDSSPIAVGATAG